MDASTSSCIKRDLQDRRKKKKSHCKFNHFAGSLTWQAATSCDGPFSTAVFSNNNHHSRHPLFPILLILLITGNPQIKMIKKPSFGFSKTKIIPRKLCRILPVYSYERHLTTPKFLQILRIIPVTVRKSLD
jgi:hypothetical protein